MSQVIPLESPRKRVDFETGYAPLAHLLAGLLYPLWFLLTPDGAIDAWWTWASVGGVFVVSAGLGMILPTASKLLRRGFPGCWASTFQTYTLASLNDMHPLYTVESVTAVLAVCVVVKSKNVIFAYGVFVTVLAGALLAIEPNPIKVACWLGILPIVAFTYERLSSREVQESLELQYRSRLEHQVEQRTQELTEANQKLHREMLERERLEERARTASKMEAVGRLAGGMAHEFNNLLTRIRLYSELAVEAAGGATRVRHEVDEIQRAAGSAGELTKQLLSLSLQGQTPRSPIDLNDVVRSNEEMIQTLLPEFYLECRLSREPLVVLGDFRELEQILVNLALNARDATTGAGAVVIETFAADHHAWSGAGDDPPNGWAVLRFIDSGHGMDPETRERAFDPFFTRKRNGTGLGLSVIQGIVKQANGHITVDSKPGQGASFEIYWPLASGCVDAPRSSDASASSSGSGERVLVVEDQDSVRTALARLIRSNGYTVETCSTAEQALELAKKRAEPFDLLVSDIVLPGMSGIELASKALTEGLKHKTLLISGHLETSDGGGLRDIPPGCVFLRKPFSSAELLSKMSQLLHSA